MFVQQIFRAGEDLHVLLHLPADAQVQLGVTGHGDVCRQGGIVEIIVRHGADERRPGRGFKLGAYFPVQVHAAAVGRAADQFHAGAEVFRVHPGVGRAGELLQASSSRNFPRPASAPGRRFPV